MSHLEQLINHKKVNTKTINEFDLTNMLGNIIQYFNHKFNNE